MSEKPPAYNPQPTAMYPTQYPQPGGPYQQHPPQGGQYNPPTQQHGSHYQPQPTQPGTTSSVTVVTVDQSGGAPEKWSWGNLILATISMCCCWCLGLPAMLLAVLAYTDHKVKDFARSAKKRSCARGLGIAGIVCGCIFLLIIILSGALRRG